tara:strand:+ start:477 stop:770 length:294 start_codon:yes stop_codon:yes gene_type:complete
MRSFKNFIGDNNIKISDKGGLYSYIDQSGQEWLVNRIVCSLFQENTDFGLPTRINHLCEFTATNGAGFVDRPIKGNRDDLQFIATFKEGIELLKCSA